MSEGHQPTPTRPAHAWREPEEDEPAPSMPGYFAMYGGLFLVVIFLALAMVALMKALR